MPEKQDAKIIPFPEVSLRSDSASEEVGINVENVIVPFQSYDAHFDEHITSEQRLYYKTAIEKLRAIFKELISNITEAENLLKEFNDPTSQKETLIEKYHNLLGRAVYIGGDSEDDSSLLELQNIADIFNNPEGESIRDLIDDLIDELNEKLDDIAIFTGSDK